MDKKLDAMLNAIAARIAACHLAKHREYNHPGSSDVPGTKPKPRPKAEVTPNSNKTRRT